MDAMILGTDMPDSRRQLLTTAPFTFYDGNPLAKKNFQESLPGRGQPRGTGRLGCSTASEGAVRGTRPLKKGVAG